MRWGEEGGFWLKERYYEMEEKRNGKEEKQGEKVEIGETTNLQFPPRLQTYT